MTSAASRNAISSPAPESGLQQLDMLAGLTTAPSGQVRARARGKASPAKGSEPMIQGICGRTYFASPVPDGPLSSWENRLRQRLARIGSTESALIWTTKATPSGRLISRLAPSMRHTNGNDCIGLRWTTVSARDWKDSAGMAIEAADGRVRLDQLPRQMVSYSPTPKASTGGPDGDARATGKSLQTVMASYNPTPTVADVQGGRKTRSGARKGEPLLNGLLAAYSPTPTLAGNYNRKGASANSGDGLCTAMTDHFAMDHSGPTMNGSSAKSTAKRGAPNPEFPFWLMGWPTELVAGVLQAMRSFSKRPPKSSAR